jgi:hypothetical protein
MQKPAGKISFLLHRGDGVSKTTRRYVIKNDFEQWLVMCLVVVRRKQLDVADSGLGHGNTS